MGKNENDGKCVMTTKQEDNRAIQFFCLCFSLFFFFSILGSFVLVSRVSRHIRMDAVCLCTGQISDKRTLCDKNASKISSNDTRVNLGQENQLAHVRCTVNLLSDLCCERMCHTEVMTIEIYQYFQNTQATHHRSVGWTDGRTDEVHNHEQHSFKANTNVYSS